MKKTIIFILISIVAANLPVEMAADLNEYRNMEVHPNTSLQKKRRKIKKRQSRLLPCKV